MKRKFFYGIATFAIAAVLSINLSLVNNSDSNSSDLSLNVLTSTALAQSEETVDPGDEPGEPTGPYWVCIYNPQLGYCTSHWSTSIVCSPLSYCYGGGAQ